MGTATVDNVRLVLAAAVARGLSPSMLLAEVGLEPQALLAPEGRVPALIALRLWHVAAELCADPSFGITAAEHIQSGSYGALGYAMHSSATLGEGLRRLVTFFRLVNQRATLVLLEEGDTARIRFLVEEDVPPEVVRHPVECTLSAVLRFTRKLTGERVSPLSVSFQHSAPADLSVHNRAFGDTLAFGQPHSELALSRRVLALPQRGADPSMAELMERHLRRLLQELPPEETFLVRVRGVLLEELRRGEPSLEILSERLRLSKRTLQRRLKQEGTSLQQLLDEVRRELALRHLGESKESIAEVAFLLGFSEVSAFHRAFKRWTGSTPGEYRQALP